MDPLQLQTQRFLTGSPSPLHREDLKDRDVHFPDWKSTKEWEVIKTHFSLGLVLLSWVPTLSSAGVLGEAFYEA